MGLETRALGGNVLLAPTINILRHPRWGRAQETYGEDPWHMARMGVGFIRGAQEHVIASAKHFAVNSIENTRLSVNVTVDERTLREIYLPHFRAAVEEAAVGSVMSAYNDVNGTLAGQNSHLLRDILRDEWGFLGFVESDWVFAVEDSVEAIEGGLDIEMPGPIFYGEPLANAVRAELVPESLIDDAVRRILRAKLCFGLDAPVAVEADVVESAEHTGLAREVAERGLVLLRNEEVTLPLAEGASLVVVGALADVGSIGDRGSSAVNPSYVISPLAGIEARSTGDVVHVADTPLSDDDRAVIASAEAIVMVVGLTSDDEGEGLIAAGDRVSMVLPRGQDELINEVAELSDSVVVVLQAGSAVLVEPWIDQVEALVMAWYPGMEGGSALASILFGDTAPSGRLPIVWPRREADLPIFENELDEVVYDYFHGYRHLDRAGVEPRFPFGFGLGYTAFEYGNLRVSADEMGPEGAIGVAIDVTNTGDVPGIETVQLYVGYPDSAVVRAERDLRAFARVALEPGESETVVLPLRAADLAYWDVSTDTWGVEATEYRVDVGPNSSTIAESLSVSVR